MSKEQGNDAESHLDDLLHPASQGNADKSMDGLINQFSDRLSNIERKLDQLLSARPESAQEFYSTADVARILEKAEWTVREWCRLGRINAEKRESGRGCAKEWMISDDELQRIRSEGLLPTHGYRHKVR